MAVPAGLAQRVEAVRRFNRFYTRRIGVLDEDLLGSPFSLAEARVLYEMAHRTRSTAAALGRDLGLDPGYLSRVLGRLRRRGLVGRKASTADGRQVLLSLTDRGQRSFAALDRRSQAQIGDLLRPLSPAGQARMVEAMGTIESLMGAPSDRKGSYVLRPHQPGDMGWVVHRHGALYAQEFGWDETFEALVATIAARFIQRYDARRERCWIAEKDGAIVGSVFLVKRTKTVAQLRLLLVEPEARGLGLGRRLVDECVRFARRAGYRKMMLWTNGALHAARRIYEQAGFRLVHQAKHHSFGHDQVEQTWELKL
jgi:DNA-binding MarR family transcriptional regulator/GNAT superfamily N-acetyltransferase